MPATIFVRYTIRSSIIMDLLPLEYMLYVCICLIQCEQYNVFASHIAKQLYLRGKHTNITHTGKQSRRLEREREGATLTAGTELLLLLQFSGSLAPQFALSHLQEETPG